MQFRLNHSRFVENGLGARTYYAGGSIEAERMMNSSAYRFGQNTQEADMEISGTWGTHYTAEFWEYDARLMRRWLTRSGRDLGDDGRSDDNAYIVERVTKEYPDLTSFLNGKLNAKYNETYRGWYDGSSPLRKQRANAGTINALLGGFDYSYGGWQWDGKEQATMFNGSIPSITFTDKNGKEITWNSKAWSQGWTISDDHYKTWKTAIEREGGTFIALKVVPANSSKAKGQTQLHSTACYGTTIFWDVITK